jgi:biotin operon repressor
MPTEIDSLTIKDLESRYGVARSNIYNRIDGLKKKGYAMEPEKQGGKSVFNADQIALMDALDASLKDGQSIADFPSTTGRSDLSYVSQDKSKVSHRTQDSKAEGTSIMLFAGVIDAIAEKVADIISIRQAQPIEVKLPELPTTDLLSNLRSIQEACDRGWLLSTSQLASLLGVKTLSGKTIQRFGFTFTRVGRNGAESAWKVERLPHG